MNKTKGKKLGKKRVALIIFAAVICLLVTAVIVLNVFIPVKYLFAYMVPAADREDDTLTVTFIDVGYGDSTLIELPDGKNILIDGGDGAYANNSALIRTLNERGVDTIDYLVCSTFLGEYCGGLPEIIKYKDVKNIYMPAIKNIYITQSYASFCKAAYESGAQLLTSEYGAGVFGDDYFFAFLSPQSPDNPEGCYAALNSEASEENMFNASAVMWLEYGGTSFAFTSSAGSAALSAIVDDYEIITAAGDLYCAADGRHVELPSCNIVSVPGHGREECTSARWYSLLSPEVAVISVGENYSSYPSAQALADIGQTVASPVLTSNHGNITIKVTAQGYYMS